MRSLWTGFMVLMLGSPVLASPVVVPDSAGRDLTVEIIWQSPVDLDLFLTDAAGETVYFANRVARSGVRMQVMTGCRDISDGAPPYGESIYLPGAHKGVYRVSVDFIKDCDSHALTADFRVRLRDNTTGQQLGQGRSSVKYRLLDTIGWEFEVQ